MRRRLGWLILCFPSQWYSPRASFGSALRQLPVCKACMIQSTMSWTYFSNFSSILCWAVLMWLTCRSQKSLKVGGNVRNTFLCSSYLLRIVTLLRHSVLEFVSFCRFTYWWLAICWRWSASSWFWARYTPSRGSESLVYAEGSSHILWRLSETECNAVSVRWRLAFESG